MTSLGYRDPKAARTLTPSTQDIVWAAGFYEGDGSTDKHQSTETVTFTQKDDWALNRLRSLFGGKVGIRRKQGINVRTYNVWRLSGARARGFLQSIYGLLSPRRQVQIKRVLSKSSRRRKGTSVPTSEHGIMNEQSERSGLQCSVRSAISCTE